MCLSYSPTPCHSPILLYSSLSTLPPNSLESQSHVSAATSSWPQHLAPDWSGMALAGGLPAAASTAAVNTPIWTHKSTREHRCYILTLTHFFSPFCRNKTHTAVHSQNSAPPGSDPHLPPVPPPPAPLPSSLTERL